jgi:exosortase
MDSAESREAMAWSRSENRKRLAWFAGIIAASFAIGWKPLATTYSLAWRAEEYTHILMVLPASLLLIYLSWNSTRSATDQKPRMGVVLLIVALVLVGLAKWQLAPDWHLAVVMLALIFSWLGTFALCFGTEAFDRALFPICFLFWMVPLPLSFLDYLVKQLQYGSAVAASILFSAVNIPVMHDGVRLSIPGLTVEVAKECSSIRSSLMLVVTTMVLVQLLLQSPLRKSLVVAAAIPLSIAKNGLRIFTIAVLGTHIDPAFLTGRLHRNGGFIFLAIALASIFVMIEILRRGERQAVTPSHYLEKDVIIREAPHA